MSSSFELHPFALRFLELQSRAGKSEESPSSTILITCSTVEYLRQLITCSGTDVPGKSITAGRNPNLDDCQTAPLQLRRLLFGEVFLSSLDV